jgi:hypothetical protein
LREIDSLPAAKRLVLAGGTALALRIGHRLSADLDFLFPTPRLPRRFVAALIEMLRREHHVAPLPNVAAEQEFIDTGLELADYQQDYGIDGVKVTFFVPDPARMGDFLKGETGVAGLKHVRVLDLPSLFLMKAVTINHRITARDLFDLHTLIERHRFALADVFEAAQRFGHSPEVLKTRLLHASRRRDDPGVETPSATAPTFEHLRSYFAAAIDRAEQAEAEAVFSRPAKPRSRRRRK